MNLRSAMLWTQPFRSRLAAVIVLALLFPSATLAEDVTLPVWPQDVPGEASLPKAFQDRVAELESKNTPDRVYGVTRPTLTVRLADSSTATGTAVLICPGGGYNVLAWAKEGLEVADWLNSLGVHAFVLQYRVPRREPDFSLPPLQDAQRAMRIIRSQALKWGIVPDRIGVLGFSAGGNLSVNLATMVDPAYEAIDEVDKQSFRPNFMIPIYAAYLGNPDDDQWLNPKLKIDKSTPPTFLAVTQDDKNRGIHAALLFAQLTQAGVPAELHVYTKGGHGYGLRPSSHPVHEWPTRCADWMRQMNLIPPRQ